MASEYDLLLEEAPVAEAPATPARTDTASPYDILLEPSQPSPYDVLLDDAPVAPIAPSAGPRSNPVMDAIRRVPAEIARGAATLGGGVITAIDAIGGLIDRADAMLPEGEPYEDGSTITAKVVPFGENMAAPRDWLREVQERAAGDYGVDPARDKEIVSKVLGGVGSVVPIIASGPFAPVTGGLTMGESVRQDAEAKGATGGQQMAAFGLGTATGVISEALLGLPALLRSAKATGATDNVVKGLARQVVTQAFKSAGREAGQEAIEQVSQNFIANTLVGYDPTRPTTAGVGEAAALGAVIGGPLGAVVQTAATLDQRRTDAAAAQAEAARVLDQSVRGEATAPVVPTPEERSAVLKAAAEVAVTTRAETGSSSVDLAKVMEAAGIAPERARGIAMAMRKSKDIESLDYGDWSNYNDEPKVQAYAVVDEAGDRHLRVRFAEQPAGNETAVLGKVTEAAPETKRENATEFLNRNKGADATEVLRRAVNAAGVPPQDAGDVVNIAYKKAFTKSGQFDPAKGNMEQWLSGIARKSASDYRTEQAKQAESYDAPQPGSERTRAETVQAPTDQAARVAEMKAIAKDAIAGLPKNEQGVMTMALEGKSNADIAKATKMTEASVRTIKSRGLKKLQLLVAERDGIPANDWTTATIPRIKELPSVSEPAGPEIGIVPPGTAQLVNAGQTIVSAAKRVASAIRNLPKFHDFRRAILNWSARNQASSGEVLQVARDILKSVPDKFKRDAITNWIQANGDVATLTARAKASKNRNLQKGYEAALKLTPEEQAVASKIRQTYDILLQRAKAHGIEISEIENYVNQIWKRQPLRDFAASSNRKLSTSIRFAKQRYYDSFFDGEQSGLKPETKDIAKLLPIYINEVNNAISAKQFVADMAEGKAGDGRPLLSPSGAVKVIEDTPDAKSYMVLPDMKPTETADYKGLEQPALHKWVWRAKDGEGNPIFVKGDLLVHPDAYSHLKNVLGQSALREWYRSPSENALADIPKVMVKFLVDDVQQIGKATMLGFLSPFHQVQEGTHAIGHKVNPFSHIPKIDLSDPAQMDAAQHGLMLLPDRVSAQQFREGLDGSNRNLLSNLIGKVGGKPGQIVKSASDGYQHYLFHEYIPGLKLKTYEHILDRNQKRYVDELANGTVTPDQIKYLSAQQSNAAYGHLNYADMGRNPTIQHIAQAVLLAPDFLEARTRFAGQAVRGAVSKVGREQLAAIATLAVTQFILARILNQVLDDDPHWDHPFDVIVGNRRYTMRSVPEDIYKATQDTRRFISGRLSPLVGRGLLEGLSGVNYRSEPTTIAETFTNILSGMVPLTVQPATRGLSETGKDNPVTPFEQLLGSLGLHVSRFSPTSEVYHLSKEWVEKHGKEYGLEKRRAVFPVSKYQQLRYALEDSDTEKAGKEVSRLMAEEKINRAELSKRFKMSMNHPFTGSNETDKTFRKSLDARGQIVFDAAKKRRQLLIDRERAIHGQ